MRTGPVAALFLLAYTLAGCTAATDGASRPPAPADSIPAARTVGPVVLQDSTAFAPDDPASPAVQRYWNGLKLKDVDPDAARKEFLAALRLKPDLLEALQELRNIHFTMTEDQMNGRLSKQKIQRDAEKARKAAKEKEKEDVEETLDEEEYEVEDQTPMAVAIALYKAGSYEKAVKHFSQLRSSDPSNAEISRYLNLSYLGLGITAYNNKEFKRAIAMFQKVPKGFESADSWIKKSTSGMKLHAEELYKTGMKFYREQNLTSAIEKWRETLSLDPGHSKAKEYLDKAMKLQSTLEKQKK